MTNRSLQPPNVAVPGPLPKIDHSCKPDARHRTKGRRGLDKPTKGVIHNTEGTDSRAWLSTTSSPPVSIHVLIARDGTRYNIVDYGDTAYHVGDAIAGYSNVNCLGVELESRNRNGRATTPYTAAQYNVLAHLLATWIVSYGLDYDEDIKRHGDIALPAGRRHDPSGLDMGRLKRETMAWLTFFRALDPADHHLWII
jgi:N-acetyl-anhydromuramyl-L-alanine amidase AmpD